MQIRKTLNDISNMLNKQTGQNITLTQTAADQIRIHYLINMDLTLIGHTENTLLLQYRLGWGTNLLAKSASSLFSRLPTRKLSVDPHTQTIQIHLNVFGEFKSILNTHHITAAKIEHSVFIVDLAENR